MFKFGILIAFAVLLNAAACASQPQTAGNQSNRAAAANAKPAIAAEPVWRAIKSGRGVGVVTAVDKQNSSVEINHEEIKDMMPAMTMMFNVADKMQLANLKPGDKVEFTLQENDNREEKIVQINAVGK